MSKAPELKLSDKLPIHENEAGVIIDERRRRSRRRFTVVILMLSLLLLSILHHKPVYGWRVPGRAIGDNTHNEIDVDHSGKGSNEFDWAGNEHGHKDAPHNCHGSKHGHHGGKHKGHVKGFHEHEKRPHHGTKRLLKAAQKLVSKDHIRDSIEHYFTAGPHLAGQNIELVNWTKSAFEASGFDTNVETYDIWLNYPISHRVALLDKDGTSKFELSLEEPVIKEDETTGRKDRIPTFHGYSASGNVTGKLVYANFGSYEDFQKLKEEGIDIKNKVVIVRYGGIFRGLKVRFAEEHGASAVLIYSDPAEDGEITEENGYKAYPDGPARHPDSVQRGSVQDISHAPGDPTSPGFPSLPGDHKDRTDPQGIPGIPSIPISYADALPLLKALNGRGPQFHEWKGALKGIEYNTGPSSLEVVVENEQDYEFRPNYDVIARFTGESDDEVIIGNHRDAWILGGADPNSGSAVILEVARVFGELTKRGWKPKRTVVFASWDGEEYGLLGSTEWGEDHADHLKGKAVAYINCDVGVSGTKFNVEANPLLHPIIYRATDLVKLNGSSLSSYWEEHGGKHIGPLGSGSDFTVFQDHLGVPSLDVGFAGGANAPVYHYHSNYDSLYWMRKFGDPELLYHEAVTKFVIATALELIESEFVPFETETYAQSIQSYLEDLLPTRNHANDTVQDEVTQIFASAVNFSNATEHFSHYVREVRHDLKKARKHRGFWNYIKYLKLLVKRAKINRTLKEVDRKFLYEEGLDSRPWFKHIIYAPGRYTGYSGQVFPGIAESLEDGDDANLVKWITIARERLNSAADLLFETAGLS